MDQQKYKNKNILTLLYFMFKFTIDNDFYPIVLNFDPKICLNIPKIFKIWRF